MLRGLYSAASGMITQQRKHDTIANNIANINTPGFKQNHAAIRSFPEMLISLIGGNSGQAGGSNMIGRLHTGVLAEESLSAYQQGDLQETQNPFDFAVVSNIQVDGVAFDGSGKAISPEGQRIFQPQAFFTVLNDNGEDRYTRNGKFTVNGLGELVTSEGYKVLGQDRQPIQLINAATQNQTLNVTVTKTGQLIDADSGEPVAAAGGNVSTMLISVIENPNQLVREGQSSYMLSDDADAVVRAVNPEDNVEIRQGFIERSNVDPIQAMTDMMTALRAYEANQKVVQAYDRSLEKAVNEVGRV